MSKLTRKFFLFFDFAYGSRQGVEKAKEAAFHFVDKKLQPTDEVGVLSYSTTKRLELHRFLTSDHQLVRKAIAKLDPRNAETGKALDVELHYLTRGGGSRNGSPHIGSSLPRLKTVENLQEQFVKNERQASKSQAKFFFDKMIELAKALRYVPGQKSIIFFSTGVPYSLLYGIESLSNGLFTLGGGDHDLQEHYENMVKELSAAGCSIFALDTRPNAKVETMFEYESDTFGDQGRAMGFIAREKSELLTGLFTLLQISKETGGKYFGNINEYQDSLEQIQNMTGSYYILGYPIDERWDGRFHKIKIQVNQKDLYVHAQSGYFNPKPFKKYSDLEKQLHLFDLALSERPIFQTPLILPMKALFYTVGNESRLQLVTRVPNEIILKFFSPKAEFVSLIFDEEENLISLQRKEADLRRYSDSDLIYFSGAVLSPGDYQCRLVVRDLENGNAAMATDRISLSTPSSERLKLHSPFLLLHGRSSAYLESNNQRKDLLSSWKEIYPYDPAQYIPLVEAVPKGTPKIFALLPYSSSEMASENISLGVDLIDVGSGKKISQPISVISKTKKDSVNTLFLEMSINEVPAGSFLVFFRVEDPASQTAATARTLFIIR
jgi:VWFA-related protein